MDRPLTDLVGEGRRRVVIDDVRPNVDRGRFAVKRIAGDELTVETDIFPDGHEEIMVLLRHRTPGATHWHEQPMKGPDNDVWQGTLTLRDIGRHEYTVVAWIDHFASWRRDLEIRARESVVSAVDLHMGAELASSAAARAGSADTRPSSADAEQLLALASRLRSEHLEDATVTGLSHELSTLVRRHPERNFESTWDPPLVVVVDRLKARFGAWYELFPRSTSPDPGKHGTFGDVIDRLEYIDRLGFDVLYLPPVHPIGTAFRKGPNNSLETNPADPGVPWAIGSEVGGHVSTHPQLGSIDDFDALVAAARERGIDIALDLAFQTSPDHPWVKEHRDWFKSRPDGTIQYAENPPKKYQDAYPLDFESADWQSLWNELLSVVRFWMKHGVRIFRVDNPHTKPFDFWEWLISDIKATDPDVIFLAEAFTRPKVMYRLGKLGFSQSYTYFTWRNGKDELREYFEHITRPPVSEFFRPNLFTNTPDILHEYLQTGGRAAFEVRFILAATLGATYGIYGPPFELLEGTPLKAGSEEYVDSEKYQLRHWDLEQADSVAPLIKQVNAIRRAHRALQSDRHLTFQHSDDDAVLAYTKQDDHGDVVLTVVNLDPTATRSSRILLALDELGLGHDGYHAHELLGGNSERRDAPYLDVSLDPGDLPARIFHLTVNQPDA